MEEMEACCLLHAQIADSNPACGNDFEINSPDATDRAIALRHISLKYLEQNSIAVL